MVLVFVFAVVTKNVIHEAVVYTTFPAPYQAMGTADQPAVWELTRTLLVIAATWAERY
jgi:hypothetical protein